MHLNFMNFRDGCDKFSQSSSRIATTFTISGIQSFVIYPFFLCYTTMLEQTFMLHLFFQVKGIMLEAWSQPTFVFVAKVVMYCRGTKESVYISFEGQRWWSFWRILFQFFLYLAQDFVLALLLFSCILVYGWGFLCFSVLCFLFSFLFGDLSVVLEMYTSCVRG